MLKPRRLRPGDTIATISPSWGCAGTNRVKWKYELGVRRLRELGLDVVAAPNSMKGTSYLDKHPQARAEDLMWAFENQNVRAIIANIGGNDSERLLPFLDPQVILRNPKILCGYSDVLALHLYCHRLGLSTFYGDNLLTVVAEAGGWHPYSRYWFQKVFFDSSPIGEIPPSPDWSYTPNNHTNPEHRKVYIPSDGYVRIQGSGRTCRIEHGQSDFFNFRQRCAGISPACRCLVVRVSVPHKLPSVTNTTTAKSNSCVKEFSI